MAAMSHELQENWEFQEVVLQTATCEEPLVDDEPSGLTDQDSDNDE